MAVRVGIRGGLSVDHLVVAGSGSRFDELGGPGLYGVLGARLVTGATAVLAAGLPADDPRFATRLGGLGVELGHAVEVPAVPRVWILNSAQGRRIVATAPLGDVELEPETAPSKAASPETAPVFRADAAFYAGLDGLLESSPAARPAVRDALAVGVDPHQLLLQGEGPAYLARVSTPGSVLLPSRVQLRLVDPDPRRAARELAAALGLPVVARLDRDGMYVVDGRRRWLLSDSAVEVVETTGAGDSSAGAIVAALARGADLVTAAGYGMSVARIALSDWGSAALMRSAALDAPSNHITTTQEL